MFRNYPAGDLTTYVDAAYLLLKLFYAGNKCLQKVRQHTGILYRKFYGHSNSLTLQQIYLSYVRPHLEYAAPVWVPHQQGHTESLERGQKFALKICTKSWDSSYDGSLNSCNLPTLVQRRHRLKLSFLYQVLHGNFSFPDAPLVI